MNGEETPRTSNSAVIQAGVCLAHFRAATCVTAKGTFRCVISRKVFYLGQKSAVPEYA